MTTPVHDSPWMLVAEVCEYARATRVDVLKALKDGSLRGQQRKTGGKWRVHRDDVDAWIRCEPPTDTHPQFTRGRRSA